jgi:hypothetical protein
MSSWWVNYSQQRILGDISPETCKLCCNFDFCPITSYCIFPALAAVLHVVFNPSQVLNLTNLFVWSTCYIRTASVNLKWVWGLVNMCLCQFLCLKFKDIPIFVNSANQVIPTLVLIWLIPTLLHGFWHLQL